MGPRASSAEAVARLVEEGRGLLHAGKPEEARVRFSEALKMAPQDRDARESMAACAVALGHQALERGSVEAAISHFQLALDIAPFHPAANAGLRRAARSPKPREAEDPLLAAIERLPPVQAFREAQVAERTIAKITGTQRPSQLLADRLDERRAAMEQSGATPREHRVASERARAWERRWLFRSLPMVAVAVAVGLWLATGAIGFMTWGLLLAVFAGVWALLFVEKRGSR